MRIVDRYIASTVIKATLTALLVLVVLAFVLMLIEEIEDVGKGDYRSWDAMLVAFCSTPRYIFEAFPVSALIGALLGLGGMVATGELVAMQAAGLSSRQILLAVIRAGLVLMALVVVVGEGIGPVTERYANQVKLEKQNKQITFSSRNGYWAKDGDTFVNIRRVGIDGALKDVAVYEFSRGRRLQILTQAVTGSYQDDHWVLEKVLKAELGGREIRINRMPVLAWESMVDPSLLSVALIDPLMLPLWDLHEQINALKSREQNALFYEVAFWGKIAVPLTTVAMLILAVPLVMKGERTVTAGQRILGGAMLGTLLYLFSRGFSFLVLALDLPSISVMFFPLVVILLLMLWLKHYSFGS